MNRFLALTAALLTMHAGTAAAQIDSSDLYDIAGEFAFVRIQYDSYYDGGFYGGPWLTDLPCLGREFPARRGPADERAGDGRSYRIALR